MKTVSDFSERVRAFEELDSTMKEVARRFWTGELRHGDIIRARKQTTGRGRQNRPWESPYGGLWFSYVLKPNLSFELCSLYTLYAGVALIQALKKHGVDAKIKWPNDIIYRDKKLAGVVLAFHIGEEESYINIGIGLNVNNPVPEIGINLVRHNISEEEVFNDILIELDFLLPVVENQPDELLRLWRNYDITLGKEVRILPAGAGDEFFAKALDIDYDGALLVMKNGKVQRLMAGDVSLRV